MTRRTFAERWLKLIGVEPTPRNISACLAIMQAEGNSARCNPFNTTEKVAGSTPLPGNTAGVQEYPTMKIGLEATARTLTYGADHKQYGYEKIRYAFRNDMGALRILWAWERSAWGTGGLALLCLPLVKLRPRHYGNIQIKE